MSDTISTTAKNTLAVVTASVTTAIQCVLGFTGLGAKLGIERTLIIAAAGVTIVIVVVAWVATAAATPKQRRLTGLAALSATLALTLSVLWATFTYHSILVRSSREADRTTTSFRGAILPSDAQVEFYSRPPTTIRFTGYAGTVARGKAGVERFTDTKFTLHELSIDKTIVLHHVSALPIAYEWMTGNNVAFTTTGEIWWKLTIAAATGGIVCGGAALLVWWLSSSLASEGPRPRIGFRTAGEPRTPPQESG